MFRIRLTTDCFGVKMKKIKEIKEPRDVFKTSKLLYCICRILGYLTLSVCFLLSSLAAFLWLLCPSEHAALVFPLTCSGCRGRLWLSPAFVERDWLRSEAPVICNQLLNKITTQGVELPLTERKRLHPSGWWWASLGQGWRRRREVLCPHGHHGPLRRPSLWWISSLGSCLIFFHPAFYAHHA